MRRQRQHLSALRVFIRGLWFVSVALLLAPVSGQPALHAQRPTTDDPAEALRVTSTLPTENADQVRTDTVLTLVFNRPVVPLGVPSDGEAPNPLTIEPAIEGVGEWLNTSIYTFTPATAWAGGTTYTVTVADLTALDGATLAEPFILTFTTIDPLVVEALPADGSAGVGLRPKIQITFNQPMNQASVEAGFFLRPQETDAPTPPGVFTWNEAGDGFMYEPGENLALSVAYEYGFPADTVFEVGERVALPAFRAAFVTVPPPAVVSSDPSDGSTFANTYGLNLYFASPMDPETIKPRLVFSPELYDEPDVFYRDWDNSVSVNFPFEPSTPYTVTLEAGAEDIYGNAIAEPFTFSFTTGPYPSEIDLQVPAGPVGFYDGGREKTEVFLTHRNLSQIDLALYNVPLVDFISALSSNQYYSLSYDYQPRPDALLNAWTIPSVAPENVLRYERLDLGQPPLASAASAPGAPVVCEGAIPSRAKVGDQGTVIAEPNLRARAFPPNGEIVELMYPGYAFNIVGGPNCLNGIVWWEIALREGERAWVAEGLDDDYFFEVTLAAQEIVVPVTPSVELDGGALPPGIYHLGATAPEFAESGFGNIKHIMVVGNTNLVVKTTIDSAVIWATDVRTGQPLADVNVSVFVPNRNPAAATTDDDGIARLALDRISDLYVPVVAVVDDGAHFGVGYSEWADGIAPWQYNINYSFYPRKHQVYMYTERPIYRPGQPVYFKGIVREKRDIDYIAPDDLTEVPVTIFDGNGVELFNQTLPLSPFGSFSGVFELTSDTALGYYSINVTLPSDFENYSEGGGTSFDVAEYRAPEFQVTVTPEEAEVVQGDTIQVEIDTAYFFGGPVTEATIDYYVTSSNYFYDRYRGPGRYDFYALSDDDERDDFGFSPFFGETITQGTATSDALGVVTLEIPAEFGRSSLSQTFSIEATARDASGQTVAGRAEVVVHQGLVYLGVGADQYVGTVGEPMTVNLIALDWAGEAAPGQEIQVEVVERRWSSVQELDRATGQITYEYDLEEIPVASGAATTDAEGRATFDFVPPVGGVYQATVTTTDADGNTVRAATTMWVSATDYVAWRITNDRRTELIADRAEYQVGDTAEILITSPFQGEARALVTVERGAVLFTDVIALEGNSLIYALPIDEAYAPNVYVSVVIVKGVDANNPVADFRAGLVELRVDNERLALNIEIAPDRPLAGPRETVTYTLTTTDWQGQPVSAELGVALSDLASLSVAEPRTGPILDFFYGLQQLAVRTSTALTINTDILTQFTIDVIKGGGGGGGGGGIFELREEFLDTAFWEGDVVTDAETGQAQVTITLPDNLTTWRLDARGVTAGDDGPMLAGSATLDVVSTKPLLVRPVAPRFFVVDDQAVLAALVNNNTDEDLLVEAGLEAFGVTLDGEAAQSAVVPANGVLRFEWPVTVDDGDFVELIFTASAADGEYTDATRPAFGQGDDRLIPVYRYEAPEIVGTGGALDVDPQTATNILEAIALPTDIPAARGEVMVTLQPSLAAAALDALETFENCRCENMEGVISKFLPNAAAYRALSGLDVNLPELRATLDIELNWAMQRLAAMQRADGGWGWFIQSDSDPLITAYALIGLVEARAAGLAVDSGMIARAASYLQGRYSNPGPYNVAPSTTAVLDRQAFVAYALGLAGLDEISGLSNLYDQRDNLSLYAKALVALALYEANPDDRNRIDTLLDDLFASAILSANGAHWEEAERDYFNWNTSTRSTAIILKALATLRPEDELIPNVVRWLMIARTADAWETTQETAWAVMALTDWMSASGELDADYTYRALLNDAEILAGTAARETLTEAQSAEVPLAELSADAPNPLRIESSAGEGALYYTAYLRALLPVPQIEPLERGVIVARHYAPPDQPKTVLTEARVGELVEVRLTIIAPADLHYLVVEDPLPAGVEAINPALATSQQTATDPGVQVADAGAGSAGGDLFSQWWAQYYFDDIAFYDEKVVLSATYLPAGTYEYRYLVRPSVEGTYNVIPPTGREYYFPEVFGRGAGGAFTVLPPPEE